MSGWVSRSGRNSSLTNLDHQLKKSDAETGTSTITFVPSPGFNTARPPHCLSPFAHGNQSPTAFHVRLCLEFGELFFEFFIFLAASFDVRKNIGEEQEEGDTERHARDRPRNEDGKTASGYEEGLA